MQWSLRVDLAAGCHRAGCVAGKLTADADKLIFNYGKSYLNRKNAISMYDAELPLKPGVLPLRAGLAMPGCIRDGAPDAWGRRVLINKKLGLKGVDADSVNLDELTYLLESGSDRIGALDFQSQKTGTSSVKRPVYQRPIVLCYGVASI